MAEAACRDRTDVMYDDAKTTTARLLCASCELRPSCLATALDRDERFGVWGGLTTAERRRLARERRAA